MKHSTPGSILTSDNDEPGTSLQTGGDDFLARINQTILNFKDLVKLFNQLKGATSGAPEQETDSKAPPVQPPGLADYIALAVKAGYGNMPISELIDKLGPLNLSQVLEVIKNARLKG